MNSPSPLQAPTHPSSPSAAFAPKRAFNPYEPLVAGGREFHVFEPRVDVNAEAYELIYHVEMQLVEAATSNHFDVAVHVFWESLYDPDFMPPAETLFGIARNCIREHFETHHYAPRFSAHRFGVQLRWPELIPPTDHTT